MNIRNIAIIAHVDHGKTTLVDKMIHAAKVFKEHEFTGELILDNNDQERERGITIFAKNVAIHYKGMKINVIDTPGHADFGGEVERVLNMVDGVLLLVDAFEGPMPQTRFVLQKALELGKKPVVVINKVDKPNCNPDWAHEQVFDLMFALDATEDQLDFPVVFGSAKQGWMSHDWKKQAEDITVLLDDIIKYIPEPKVAEGTTQMLVTSLDFSNYIGRIAVGRLSRGRLAANQMVSLVKKDGTVQKHRIKQLFVFDGLGKKEVPEVLAGDICAVVGVEGLDVVQDAPCGRQGRVFGAAEAAQGEGEVGPQESAAAEADRGEQEIGDHGGSSSRARPVLRALVGRCERSCARSPVFLSEIAPTNVVFPTPKPPATTILTGIGAWVGAEAVATPLAVPPLGLEVSNAIDELPHQGDVLRSVGWGVVERQDAARFQHRIRPTVAGEVLVEREGAGHVADVPAHVAVVLHHIAAIEGHGARIGQQQRHQQAEQHAAVDAQPREGQHEGEEVHRQRQHPGFVFPILGRLLAQHMAAHVALSGDAAEEPGLVGAHRVFHGAFTRGFGVVEAERLPEGARVDDAAGRERVDA